MTPRQWLAKLFAIQKVAAEYGLNGDALQTIGVVSRSPAPDKATDPKMEEQRVRDGIQSAFQVNEQLDRAVPSQMAEPGVRH